MVILDYGMHDLWVHSVPLFPPRSGSRLATSFPPSFISRSGPTSRSTSARLVQVITSPYHDGKWRSYSILHGLVIHLPVVLVEINTSKKYDSFLFPLLKYYFDPLMIRQLKFGVSPGKCSYPPSTITISYYHLGDGLYNGVKHFRVRCHNKSLLHVLELRDLP